MLMTLVADHGPVLAQFADTHASHAVLADATQHSEAAGFLQKLGKAVFGFLGFRKYRTGNTANNPSSVI